MTMMGICTRCREEKPLHVPHERRCVSRGPDGDLLCGRHYREAWREHDDYDEPLSEPLEERGFREGETPLPGDWASNVQMSIQITSKRDVDRRRTFVARVYDAPADSLELSRVQLLAEAQSADHVEATRLALEEADEEEPNP